MRGDLFILPKPEIQIKWEEKKNNQLIEVHALDCIL